MSSLPTIYLAIPALLAAGAAAGFAGGLFGIGGGFVVVPVLIFLLPLLGVVPAEIAHVAVGTSLASIIFTSIRSTLSHAERDAVDFSLLRSWAIWVVLGTAVGTMVAGLVSSRQLGLIFGIGVMAFAVYFLLPARKGAPLFAGLPTGLSRVGIASALGAFSTLLGIGGGTVTTVTMTICGAPIHRAIGTAAGMGAIIALPSTVGFMIIGYGEAGVGWGSLGYVSLPAAAALIATSVFSAPYGVAAAHHLPAAILRPFFGLYLAMIGVIMITRF
ncbi:MAG: sulfite exporter TauE/SafE family protein [Erythrobacter sp.]